jgi:hypothetical protein
MAVPDGSADQRRLAIDVARVGALGLVVLGHLTLAVIDRRPDGAIRGSNLLALQPRLAWLAMLAPMPVFFAAAGWANATATPQSATRRLRTLVGLAAVVVGVWSAASVTEMLIRGKGGLVADGARIATQPLWFLAVYVPFTSVGARIARMARRPLVAVGACLGALAAVDVARFEFGMPVAAAWPGFFVAWGVPWLIGGWWRGRWEHGTLREWRVGAILAGTALLAAATLVEFAGYSPALIDAVKGDRSNTTPPTLFTAVAAIAQVGLLMIVAGALERAGRRWRGLLDKCGAAATGIYAWHLTALALCAAALAAGLWAPVRFSVAWWLTRPIWFAVVLGATALLTVVTAWVRTRLMHRQRRVAPAARRVFPGIDVQPAAVMLATFGAALIGLRGPRTIPNAAAATASLTISWWWLRRPAP